MISSGRITDIEKKESYALVVSPKSPPQKAFIIEKGIKFITGTGWVDHSGKPHVYASDWLFTLGRCTEKELKPTCIGGHYDPKTRTCTCSNKKCQCIGTGDCFCKHSSSCFCAPAVNSSCFCEGTKECKAFVLGDGFVKGGEAKKIEAVVEAGFVNCEDSDKCSCSSLNPISAFCEQGSVETKKWDCDMPNESQCRKAKPLVTHRFKCFKEKSKNKYEAIFVYTNTGKKDEKIKIGKDNKFEPKPEDRHQPTKFKPGTHEVKIELKNKKTVVWILNGDAATVSFDPKDKCPGKPVPPRVRPVLFCVRKRIFFSGYVAYLGYESTYPTNTYIPIGKKNRFSGKKPDMGQPTLFKPGKSKPYPWEVLRIGTLLNPWDGKKMTWELDGYELKFDKKSPQCKLFTNVKLVIRVSGDMNTKLKGELLQSLSDKMHIDQSRLSLADTPKRSISDPKSEGDDLMEVILTVEDLKEGELGISKEEALEVLEDFIQNEHDSSTDSYMLGNEDISVVDGEVLLSGIEQRGNIPTSHVLAYVMVPMAFIGLMVIVGLSILIYRKRKEEIKNADLKKRLITKPQSGYSLNEM
mmetsp:Transcript_20884/g.23272  ORF Transcript_20884/g.23272 Transcript_20884/m.23272 type:complete len:580 (+) Transcript_20884:898-2637(+)